MVLPQTETIPISTMQSLKSYMYSIAGIFYSVFYTCTAWFYRAAEAFLNTPNMQLDNNTCVKYGGTALHYAKSPKFIDLVTKHSKCDVDYASKTGHTPLHVMVQRQRLECAMAILCVGADVNVRVPGGDTPLHQAVRVSNSKSVLTLTP